MSASMPPFPPQEPFPSQPSQGWQPPQHGAYGPPFASWGSRVGAYLLDFLILLGIAGVPGGVAFFGLYMLVEDAEAAETAGAVGFYATVILVTLFYIALTMGRTGEHNGQTWGKQAVGIRVVRENQTPVGGGFALLRELLVKNFLMGLCFVVQIIDALIPLSDDRNQSWHDKIVGTFVVRA